MRFGRLSVVWLCGLDRRWVESSTRLGGFRLRALKKTPEAPYTKGYERYYPPTNFFAEEHTTCVDGRATTRHLHGRVQLTVRYATVKVSAESADAVSR